VWTRIGFSNNSPQNIIMSSTFIVEPYRNVHGSTVSHHEAVSLPNTQARRKRNGTMCRGASSLPSRRRLLRSHASQLFFIVILWTLLVGTSFAANGDSPTFLAIHAEDDLGWKGSALRIDQRPPPFVPLLMPPLHNGALRKDEDPTNAASASLMRRAAATSIPEAFDTGFSNNFTSSCLSFLARLRANEEFKKCHPFSLMLQVRRLLHAIVCTC
jgi:hypothetical protein